jgi:phosphoribosylglycinamide formyltransferase-1
MTAKKRVGVLISGRGSNLSALIAAAGEPDFPAEIVTVISNVPNAAGLQYAEGANIAVRVVNHRDFTRREDFDAALTQALVDAGVELVCNAGFMRLHSPQFVAHWRGRQLNIHPSLLPAFRGLHPQRRALEAGVRISGCTVHFVSEETDAGPIVAQGAAPVLPADDLESLSTRILKVEHRLYPLALKLVASGKARLAGDKVLFAEDAVEPFIFMATP